MQLVLPKRWVADSVNSNDRFPCWITIRTSIIPKSIRKIARMNQILVRIRGRFQICDPACGDLDICRPSTVRDSKQRIWELFRVFKGTWYALRGSNWPKVGISRRFCLCFSGGSVPKLSTWTTGRRRRSENRKNIQNPRIQPDHEPVTPWPQTDCPKHPKPTVHAPNATKHDCLPQNTTATRGNAVQNTANEDTN